MHAEVHPKNYYRLPWTLNDNVLCWLEPTKRCNLYCEGCYSRNDPQSDKTLDQVRADIEAFLAQRNVDSISIAGGDPLVHPQIVDIVRMISHDYGKKPVVNTNALALDDAMLYALRDAGVYGFTFHIDSSQGRPGWKNATELELNTLRLQMAEKVARAGDMSVAFNSTVFPHTQKYVPDLMDWAAEHIDIVHSMVFILFRTFRSEEFDYFAGGEKVNEQMEELVYYDQDKNPAPITTPELIETIRAREPAYTPCAYLGGTKDPNSMKWTLAARFGAKGRIHGYAGPKYMEAVQTVHHAATGKWLGYVQPSLLKHGRTMFAGFSPFDAGIRQAGKNWLKDTARRPWRAKDRVHFQSILIIQPIDMMAGGEQNMCDGCPDMTVHNGELVWSCRLEELQQYGCFLSAAPKAAAAAKGETVAAK